MVKGICQWILYKLLGYKKIITQELPEKYIICIDPGYQIRANLSKEANGPGSKTMKTKVSGGTHGTTTGIPEYKLTLVIGKKLRKELKSRGYKVVMTCTKNDVDISNKERAEYATKKNADITIRLHADGAASSEANGASVLCPSSKNPYIASLYKKSKKLSTSVIDFYCNKTGMNIVTFKSVCLFIKT